MCHVSYSFLGVDKMKLCGFDVVLGWYSKFNMNMAENPNCVAMVAGGLPHWILIRPSNVYGAHEKVHLLPYPSKLPNGSVQLKILLSDNICWAFPVLSFDNICEWVDRYMVKYFNGITQNYALLPITTTESEVRKQYSQDVSHIEFERICETVHGTHKNYIYGPM